MSVTFQVSNVRLDGIGFIKSEDEDCNSPFAAVKKLMGITPEAAAINQWNVRGTYNHGFISTVNTSYANHYPLIISPDDIWLCISQGFAQHVNANAETLRKQFVQHEGKEIITIDCPRFVKGSRENPWPEVFPQFSNKIAEYIGKKRDLLVGEFSTTGVIEKCASEIVLMEAMQQYFGYRCQTLCGIPKITLLGTVEDWKLIKAKTLVLAEFDCKWWIDALVPIIDNFINAFSGKADPKIWESFFKVGGGSGGPYISGWINTLFPYLEDYQTKKCTNKNSFVTEWQKSTMKYSHGPTSASFSKGLSCVPFVWDYYGKEISMQFIGGFMGTSQDKETLAVRSAIGWAVAEK